MSPTEHGEVYVLDDGGEADLDLGNYERYLDVTLSRENNLTTGCVRRPVELVASLPWGKLRSVVDRCASELTPHSKIYSQVIEKEARLQSLVLG